MALAAALSYGASDFLGGFVARRVPPVVVVVLSQALGLVLLVPILLLFESRPLEPAALLWGASAGFGGGTGVWLLYRGMARGRMSVVAPITGVVAAVVPVVVGLALGERPGLRALVGVIIAMAAVVLVSSAAPDTHGSEVAGVADAFGSGVCFGAFFVLLERAGDDVGMWPVAGARLGAMFLLVAAAIVLRTRITLPVSERGRVIAVAALEVVALVCYVLATQRGLLSLVAVLTSMYPAVVVVLARVVLKERFRRSQIVGMVCAVAGVGLITLG